MKVYAVEIQTESGPMISRLFSNLKAARKWAKWTALRWPTRIMYGGMGGMDISVVENVPRA